jgi:MFS family permease
MDILVRQAVRRTGMSILPPDSPMEVLRTPHLNPEIAVQNGPEVSRLRDLSAQQWKSGIAAWLGWLFDGLDMHLYILVAAPFVAVLLGASSEKDPRVGYYSSWIQAAFLIGWALGGGFFGRIADRLGRSRALTMTILTYALFTGMSFFAQTWWQLLIFRFLAALGIGGEWAVGASLLSETWPRRWRPWMAAVLQTGVNLGVMLAALSNYLLLLADFPVRTVFLVGILPALLVFWIRRAVPEPEEWQGAKLAASGQESGISSRMDIPVRQAERRTGMSILPESREPGFLDLFRGSVRRTTVLTLTVCALTLTAHWAFLFWYLQHLRNHPDLVEWTDSAKGQLVSKVVWLVIGASIVGNFLAAALARWLKYRRAIAFLCLAYFAAMFATYYSSLGYRDLWYGYAAIGLCQGLFALFTMYMPPLFPTLLRPTGAGFCYNFGRIVAGLGTVFFGLFAPVHSPGDYRLALLYAGFLFLPAAAVALILPEPPDESAS